MQIQRLEERERDFKKIKSRRKDFSSILHAQQEGVEARVRELLFKVDRDAEHLKREPNPYTVSKYKESVKEFVEYVLEKVYRIRENIGIPLNKRRKIYVIAECINDALRKLVEEVLNEQMDCMKIVEKVDQIKGLLLDLYN